MCYLCFLTWRERPQIPTISFAHSCKLVQVAISQLLGSVAALLQEAAQSRVSAVKAVTLIIIKIPVYLDSRGSQLGEPHIAVPFSDYNRVCSGCVLHRALSAKVGSVCLSCGRKLLPDASMTPTCPHTPLCFPSPYSQDYQSLRLEG